MTPLYERMKNRGTSLYAFPSAAYDLNYYENDNYKISFNKFVLLKFPQSSAIKDVMNFKKENSSFLDLPFHCFDPNTTVNYPYSEQLVEHLRNYTTNYDAEFRNSLKDSRNDFYNQNEMNTPSEQIFWKWCRKLNLMDFEPAIHKVDYNKNDSDFNNPNATTVRGNDYFRKYLWKERDVNLYNIYKVDINYTIYVSGFAKFRTGDKVLFQNDSTYFGNSSYTITNIIYSSTTTSDFTIITLDNGLLNTYQDGVNFNVYLEYERFVQYIGEIQSQAFIQSSKGVFTDITAQVPHHAGKSPNILFDIEDDLNYYPNLQLPIMSNQIQEEIIGAEDANSNIRVNPDDYPGSYYAFFDNYNKTYSTSNGDRIRKSGDYYGVLRSNNVGLDAEDYFEKLDEFNSKKIDGLKVDFDYEHYLKMNLPESQLYNFDEFNSFPFDSIAPEDFEFNAILWYYTITNNVTNESTNNLYGVEFLNNPDDDYGGSNDKLITTYKKYVTKFGQDGTSFIYTLKKENVLDNKNFSSAYNPDIIYEKFSTDVIEKFLQNNLRLYDNVDAITSKYNILYNDMLKMKSLIYSQTDINVIKQQMNSLQSQIRLYSSLQLIDSNTVKINMNYNTEFPTMQLTAVDYGYGDMKIISANDILTYNNSNSGKSYNVLIDSSSKCLVYIKNDLINKNNENLKLTLNNDLSYLQNVDFILEANNSNSYCKIRLYVNYSMNNLGSSEMMIGQYNLPFDIKDYNSLNITGSTYYSSYYNNEQPIFQTISISTGITTTLTTTTNHSFKITDYIYVDNFKFLSGSNVLDYSGNYLVSAITSNTVKFNINTVGLQLITNPILTYLKKYSVNVMRVDVNDSSTFTNRYKIKNKLNM